MTQIEIVSKYNPSKVHVFRFYGCYHFTYNQRIRGNLFYSTFVRIYDPSTFGYADALQEARKQLKEMKS